jgi:hypothetical protein
MVEHRGRMKNVACALPLPCPDTPRIRGLGVGTSCAPLATAAAHPSRPPSRAEGALPTESIAFYALPALLGSTPTTVQPSCVGTLLCHGKTSGVSSSPCASAAASSPGRSWELIREIARSTPDWPSLKWHAPCASCWTGSGRTDERRIRYAAGCSNICAIRDR